MTRHPDNKRLYAGIKREGFRTEKPSAGAVGRVEWALALVIAALLLWLGAGYADEHFGTGPQFWPGRLSDYMGESK